MDGNGGCNLTPAVFEPLPADPCNGLVTVCGDINSTPPDPMDGSFTRDTDWWGPFTLNQKSVVTATLSSQMDADLFFIEVSNCALLGFSFGLAESAGDCQPVTLSECLAPGSWIVFVAATEADVMCGVNSSYVLTVEADCQNPCPPGACCFDDGSCQDLDFVDCALAAGSLTFDDQESCATADSGSRTLQVVNQRRLAVGRRL